MSAIAVFKDLLRLSTISIMKIKELFPLSFINKLLFIYDLLLFFIIK